MAIFRKSPLSDELDKLKKMILKDVRKKTCGRKKISSIVSDYGRLPSEENFADKRKSVLLTYSLPGKSRSEKMLFNYEIMGRNGKGGLLEKLGGKKIAAGCIIIPYESEHELADFFNKNHVGFAKQSIFLLE